MSVELRANADWLPIDVRYNQAGFEGQTSGGSQVLEVKDSVVMGMTRGVRGSHTAAVFC